MTILSKQKWNRLANVSPNVQSQYSLTQLFNAPFKYFSLNIITTATAVYNYNTSRDRYHHRWFLLGPSALLSAFDFYLSEP